MNRTFLVLAALLMSASPSLAETVVGRATVIDGDTLDIRGTRIRLHGVDAFESAQLCQGADGKPYRCGQRAALALADRIGTASVSCEKTDIDRHKRIVAVCSARGEDLNAWLVSEGHALAYRQYGKDYVPQEDAAQGAKRGAWAGSFTPPWDWRQGVRDGDPAAAAAPRSTPTTQAAASDGCKIKGNINQKGDRIFHVPGSRDYERTKLNEAAGERWFCSEAEALAAGWRAPGR